MKRRTVNITPLPGQTKEEIIQAFKFLIELGQLPSELSESGDNLPDLNVSVHQLMSEGKMVGLIQFVPVEKVVC